MCTRTSCCVAGRIIRFNGFTSFSLDLETAVSRAEHGQVLQLCKVTLWNRPVCKGSGSVNEGSNFWFPGPREARTWRKSNGVDFRPSLPGKCVLHHTGRLHGCKVLAPRSPAYIGETSMFMDEGEVLFAPGNAASQQAPLFRIRLRECDVCVSPFCMSFGQPRQQGGRTVLAAVLRPHSGHCWDARQGTELPSSELSTPSTGTKKARRSVVTRQR